MVNHDAPHQLIGRRSSWVTSYRVDKASSCGLFDAENVNTAKGFFIARPEAIKKNSGGFEEVAPLSHMNRQKNKDAGITKKRETKP